MGQQPADEASAPELVREDLELPDGRYLIVYRRPDQTGVEAGDRLLVKKRRTASGKRASS